MNRKFIYRVDHFLPPQDTGLGQYGFCVYLDRDFASQTLDKKIDSKVQEDFQKRTKEMIVKKVFSDEYILPPFMFVEDSLLVQSFHVPGNASDLGVDWNTIHSLKKDDCFRNYLEYSPHNVDSMNQAFTLLSLFTYWVDCAEATLES